ncbi:PaaI family thioesterase [Nocardia iowensis]|uniref:PaaI family thioesterase n=1 Tax=Nocardia iowensis TaxID=204891 RepID=A0ABX8RSQ1_NOCIO|nr:PaaI family thioesterase [Nocardia iowensis]QXN92022.1 PaaI family thioesterase [Nocardia iowensis]
MTGLAEASDRGAEQVRQPVPLNSPMPQGPLPSHVDGCFGCGQHNYAGVGMTLELIGDRIVGRFTFDERHKGAPGLAHGGVVAAVLDEASGTVPTTMCVPAVTAKLEVNYAKPAPLHRPMIVSAILDRREGERKLHIHARLELDGELVAEANALFVVVSPDHFFAHGAKEGELPFFGV